MTPERKGGHSRSILAATSILILLGVAASVYMLKGARTSSPTPTQRLVLCAASPANSGYVRAAGPVMQHRLDALSPGSTQVNFNGDQCFRVRIPKTASRKAVLATLSPTGFLAVTDSDVRNIPPGHKVKIVCPSNFKRCAPNTPAGGTDVNVNPPTLQVVVPGTEIKSGSASVEYAQDGTATVDYTMTDSGSSRWCAFTTNNIDRYSAIVLDNKVVTDPNIAEPICQGQTQITLRAGQGAAEAKRIATFLNFGAYPAGLHFRVRA